MHKTSDIRRNALELYAVDNSDVIKVAGIIDKLKSAGVDIRLFRVRQFADRY